MKVPLRWLADHVDCSAIPLPELVERLTLAGLEVASVRLLGLPVPEGLRVKQQELGPVWQRDQVVLAHVLSIEKHPNADKLKLVTLNYGADAPKTVVTGAPNIAVGESGHKVILGLRGTKYFMEEEDKATKQTRKVVKTLEPKALRGIDNDAMCMSNFELGISDEHDGIILLEADAPIGTPAADFMGDAVVEIDVLPNMARCLSMVGVAREVAAIFGKEASTPSPKPPFAAEPVADKVNVVIADPKRCARYAAMLIRDVQLQPAPGWMQRRLTYAGMRPINNIVDITNYVMLEWGQPLHAFDYDILVKRAGGKTPTITVRPARDGEVLRTLDGQDRTLNSSDLVIADSIGAIALAGVMGGMATEVNANTKNILLESASFDFVSIRRTAHKFTLFSEASTRFSRGVHPETVQPAAYHAAQLMAEHAHGTVLNGMVDEYPAPLPPQVVTLPRTEIKRLLGIEFTDAEVARVLSALQFTVVPNADGWTVTTPPTRLDIQVGAADLIEELARIHGYDRLHSTLLSGALPPQRNNRPLALENAIRDILANLGLHECICYSLTNATQEAHLGEPANHVELVNPISPERAVMRRNLLTNVLAVVQENLKQTSTVNVFELGAIFLPQEGQRLPNEPRRLAIARTGRRTAEAWDDPLNQRPKQLDFYDMKGTVEALFAAVHLPVTYRATKSVPFLHPGRAAEVLHQDRVLGVFGEIHPKAALAFGLADRTVLLADIDLEAVLTTIPERFAYAPVPEFPAAKRDVAVVVDQATTNEMVLKEIRAAGGELLAGAQLFDVYTGESIAEGKKSLAYALAYQAKDRVLKDAEIDKAHKKIEDRLKHVLKASIRGKE